MPRGMIAPKSISVQGKRDVSGTQAAAARRERPQRTLWKSAGFHSGTSAPRSLPLTARRASPLPPRTDLEALFAETETRVVGRDRTVRWKNGFLADPRSGGAGVRRVARLADRRRAASAGRSAPLSRRAVLLRRAAVRRAYFAADRSPGTASSAFEASESRPTICGAKQMRTEVERAIARREHSLAGPSVPPPRCRRTPRPASQVARRSKLCPKCLARGRRHGDGRGSEQGASRHRPRPGPLKPSPVGRPVALAISSSAVSLSTISLSKPR